MGQGGLQRNPELQVTATVPVPIRTHPQTLADGAGPTTQGSGSEGRQDAGFPW